MPEEFISSIGLKSGEKNISPQEDANNNWKNVDWFLHTWGFLPNDEEAISKLSDKQKNYIILLLLDFAWRKQDNKTSERMIKMVQEYLVSCDKSLGEYFK